MKFWQAIFSFIFIFSLITGCSADGADGADHVTEDKVPASASEQQEIVPGTPEPTEKKQIMRYCLMFQKC